MTQVGLQCRGVGALVRKLKAAGVPQHMGMDLEAELSPNTKTRHELVPA